MLSISHREVAIRAACTELSSLAPYFAARFAAARTLLLRGGWTHTSDTILFPGNIATTGQTCTCQEGRGPIVCLHQVASRMLAVALRPASSRQGDWPRSGWIVVGRTADAVLRRRPSEAEAAP